MPNNDDLQQFRLGEYCVIYLDIMGQKAFLADLKDCDEQTANVRITKLSMPLLRFRNGIKQQADEVAESIKEIIRESLSHNAESQKVILDWADSVSYGIQQFSDSTMLYVKMGNPVSFIVILKFVEFIVFRMLDDMANGCVLRGGIAVGQGWELDKNCLCGQVVGDAYNLEEKISQWGRITVSELFVKRFNGICGVSELFGGCGFVKLMKPLIDALRKDIDGMYFIDYLNPAVEEMYKRNHFDSDWFIERIEKGLVFMKEQRDRFQNQASKSNESARLALRYDIMRGYWDSRLQMWENLKQV